MKTLKSELSRTWTITKWVFSIYFKHFPVLTSLYIAGEIILSLAGLANAYVIALAIDKASQILQSGRTDLQALYPVVWLIIGTYAFFQVIGIINTFVRQLIDNKDWYFLRVMLADRLAFLGIQNLEKPEITNKSQRFDEERDTIKNYIETSIYILSGFISFIGSGSVIAFSMPLVTVLFFIIMIIKFLSNQKYIRLLWLLNRDTTEDRRRAGSMLNDLTQPGPLKELILSQGRNFLIKKVRIYMEQIAEKYVEIRRSWTNYKFINVILESSVFGYGIVVILQRLMNGIISIGKLTFEIRSLRIFSDSFSSFMNNLVGLREYTIKLSDVQDLFVSYEDDVNGTKELAGNLLDIRFKDVSFKYPNSTKFIFKNLNLNINSGEKIAIVGENGAGKTTLVKLLCRFYRATSGEILVSETNINDLEINSWYKKMGVLFQDYNTYTYLSPKENIEIDSSDRAVNVESITSALKKADALKFIDKYENGIDQILSERYKGGIRPSTGQWQKIAIARVFHRNSPVLILDEPTASIDAVAEAQIFDNIYKFAKDKTVIIISHRFSTVRNADRIIVLDKGKIVEQGSHEELLKNEGKYAHAFKLQAKGYQ